MAARQAVKLSALEKVPAIIAQPHLLAVIAHTRRPKHDEHTNNSADRNHKQQHKTDNKNDHPKSLRGAVVRRAFGFAHRPIAVLAFNFCHFIVP